MTLQLSLTSSSDDAVGTAKLLVSDPESVVSRIEFYTQLLPSGAVLGPFPSDRESALGVFEKDVLLDSSADTKVSAVVTLDDSSTANPTPAYVTLGARSESVPAPSIRALEVTAGYGEINVSVVPGASHSWKCWLRAGAWPTDDGALSGEVLEDYLRFEGNRDQCAFSLAAGGAEGKVWYVIAAGYDAAETVGPFLTDSIPLTYGDPQRASITAHVLEDLDAEAHREVLVEWIPNSALLEIASAAGVGETIHAVEVFRAGQIAPFCEATLPEQSCVDTSIDPVTPGTSGSQHLTLEYVVVVTDTRDGSVAEYSASVSGSFINN